MPVRLYTPASLAAEESLYLDGPQTHYIRHVMRCAVGDHLHLFNETYGEWAAVVREETKRGVVVACVERLRAPNESPECDPDRSLTLWFSPLRPGPTEWLVEKATELGATKLCPVLTRRTNRRGLTIDRWKRVAVEAAEQCGRLSVPQWDDAVSLADKLATQTMHSLWVADERRTAPTLSEQLLALPRHAATVMVGPEGGFSDEEWVLFERAHARFFTLSPLILRAETAALASLACMAQWP